MHITAKGDKMEDEKKEKPSVGSHLLAVLLSLLDLEFLRQELRKFYAEEWRWKKFDCIAMLKLDIYRIFKKKNFRSHKYRQS